MAIKTNFVTCIKKSYKKIIPNFRFRKTCGNKLLK